MSRSHLTSIFPWSKKRSQHRALSRMNQGDIFKTAKREGKLEEDETLVAGDHSVVDVSMFAIQTKKTWTSHRIQNTIMNNSRQKIKN